MCMSHSMCVEVRKKKDLWDFVVSYHMGCWAWHLYPLNLGLVSSTSLWSFDWGLDNIIFSFYWKTCLGILLIFVFGVFLFLVYFITVLWCLTLFCSSAPMWSFSLAWRIPSGIFSGAGLVISSVSLLFFVCLLCGKLVFFLKIGHIVSCVW